LAFVSLVQKQFNLKKRLLSIPIKTVVFDGVTIGMKQQLCCLERPWEIPHDLETLPDPIQPRDLYVGSELDKYTMVPDKDNRLRLWKLGHGEIIDLSEWESLRSWLLLNRPSILPFVMTEKTSASVEVRVRVRALRSAGARECVRV
jgi:hypothetical protein